MLRLFKPLHGSGVALWQRFVSFALIIAMFFGLFPGLTFEAQIAEAQFFGKSAEETYSLVAILVDKKLWDDSAKHEGLSEQDYSSISKSTLKKRIERYADDVQKSMEYTKTLILSVDGENKSVVDIASGLENIYFEGDKSGDKTNLVGVVLVGDIPLPVVNKNGNRFVSLLPYTDFEEKSYIYNAKSGDYEKNSNVSFGRSELWHGVIRAPKELNGEDRSKALASFFDKNHLYHVGHSDFAEFERGALISDLFHERELMNTSFFKYYEKYVQNAEANAYFRINKHWAEDLYKEFVGDITSGAEGVLQPEFANSLKESGGLFGNLPDIQSGQAVITQYHMPYIKLFTRYMALINDWTNYTGRYEAKDVQSVPELISVKDAYTYEYLKQVNTALENAVDGMVQKALQKHIPLVAYSNLTGNIVVEAEKLVEDGPDPGSEPDIVIVEKKTAFNHKTRTTENPMVSGGVSDVDIFNADSPLFSFLNSSLIEMASDVYPGTLATIEKKPVPIEVGEDESGDTEVELQKEEVSATMKIENVIDKLRINGISAKSIESPLDCSLYRGSSQITYSNRIFNSNNAGKKLFLGADTKPFVEYLGYDYGASVTRVIPQSPADKAGIKEGDIILQINDIDIAKPDIDGRSFMPEDIIPKLNPDKAKLAKVKYYSAQSKKETGPLDITLEDINSEKWSAGCHGINGIPVYEDGSDNSEKCVPELAKTPVFDAAAGTEISDNDLDYADDIDTAHIRSCFDIFYNEEPTFISVFPEIVTTTQPFVQWIKDFKDFNSDVNLRYMNPTKKFEAKFDPAESDSGFHPKAETIVMYDDEFEGKQYKLTFADILEHSGVFDGIDNDLDGEVDEEDEDEVKYAVNKENWAEIGQKVLSRSGNFRFRADELDDDPTDELHVYIEINVEPEVVKLISSMIPHKDPSNFTIYDQAKAMATESLPIDNERYVAFLDKNGVMQKLYYPNLFDADSYQDFQIKLFKFADKMAAVPGSENLVAGLNIDKTKFIFDSLEGVLAAKKEQLEKDSFGFERILKTEKAKLEDAVYWKNLGLDDKHSYVLQSYLNPAKDAYADEKNGYEVFYFVSDGEEDFSSFSFTGDFPVEGLDVSIDPAAASAQGGSDEGEEGSGENEEDETVYNPPLGKELDADEAVPLWLWFPEIAKWLKESIESVTQVASHSFELNPACAVDQDYNIIDAIKEAQKEQEVKNTTVAGLSLELEKDLLRADGADQTKLLVKALNSEGQLISSDSLTKLQLLIVPENQKAIITPSETTQMSNGVALFNLKATTNPGKATVQVRSINTKQVVLSKTVTITSTKRSIQLIGLEETIAEDESGEEVLERNNSDSITANGRSELVLKAALIDDDGVSLIDTSAGQVSFSIIEGGQFARLNEETAGVKNGLAFNKIKATTKAGLVKVKAEIKNSVYPPSILDIFVMPGPLHSVQFIPQSKVIKAGGLSYTPVRVELHDEFGNIKNNEIFEITLWHDGPGQFKNIIDTNLKKGGIQTIITEGVAEFNMSSTEDDGSITLHGEVLIPPLIEGEEALKFYNKGTINSVYNLVLSGSSKSSTLTVGGEAGTVVSVSAMGPSELKGVNLPVSFSFSDDTLAEFANEIPDMLKDGKAAAFIRSRTTSGDLSVIAASPGFENLNIPIKIKAAAPNAVQISEPQEALVSDNQTIMDLEARVFDKYGNFVEDDFSTIIEFSLADESKDLAQILSSQNLLVQAGKAKATIKSTYLSGPVRIRAKGKGLPFGDKIEVFSEKRIPSSKFAQSNPRALFASLLGNSFGDTSKENSLGLSVLFSGWDAEQMSAVQAVSSVTIDLKQLKTLFTLQSSGAAQVFDTSNVKAFYSQSDNDSVSDGVVFAEVSSGLKLAEAVSVLPANSFVKLADPTDATGVYVNNLTENEIYEFKENDNDLVILKDELPQISISGRGQINLLGANYSVEPVLKDSKFLGFDVFSATEKIARVSMVPQQNTDVQQVDSSYVFGSKDEGVYLVMHAKNNLYRLKEIFSGNSSNSAKSYSLQKADEDIPATQRVGGPHDSLESAFDKSGLGFAGQNKHMLLFFSGNSVGESFLPYASEAGIVLGDPTIRLNNIEDIHAGATDDIDNDNDGGIDEADENDPKYKQPLYDENSGFTDDLGQPVYTDQQNLKSFRTFDYNNDDVDDLLIAYEDGRVRLMEGLVSGKQNPFKDKGLLLNLVNGIFDIDTGDFNNDGREDIVVATKESCNQGETCVYLFENDDGYFVQKNARLLLEEKVSDFEVEDMDKDGYSDLIVADLNRNVSIFYGSDKGLNVHGDKLGGLQAEVDTNANTAHQTFISYQRNKEEKDSIGSQFGFDPFIPMTLPSNNPTDSAGKDLPLSAANAGSVADLLALGAQNQGDGPTPAVKVTAPPVRGKKLHEFLPLDRDGRVKNSVKKVMDVNGGDLRGGDELEYTITVFNSSSAIFNASVLDYFPETFEFVKGSISCEGCGGTPEIIETGIATRPYLISAINIAKNKLVKIKYRVKSANFPPLALMIGTGFDDYPEDGILDILAYPKETPVNRIVFYSAGKNAAGKIKYLKKFPKPAKEPEPIDTDPLDDDIGFTPAGDDKNANGIPDSHEGLNGDSSSGQIAGLLPDEQAQEAINDILANSIGDKDRDGLPDVMDFVNGELNKVADGIEAVLSALKCSGGCIPSPVNMTLPIPFPVTGNINLLGIKGPFVPGIPIFAVTKPSTLAPPAINTVIWPAGNPMYFESVFRIYAAPTLTGGLGTALCLGEYPWSENDKSNRCFVFAVPVLQVLGVCNALIDGITGALNSIEEGLQSASGHTTIITRGSNPQTAQGSKSASGFSSGPYPVSASVAANVRIPGFPSVIVNWLDRQTEEIIDKLTDLPDVYFITPSLDSLKNSVLPQVEDDFEVTNLHDIYAWLNSIPLITIEQKEVAVKMPWLYEDQITKLIRQYDQWIKNVVQDWERFKKNFACDSTQDDAARTLCNHFSVSVPKLVTAIEQNIQALESYRELPKKILTFRNLEAQYLRQIICYLDTITQFLGGYMEKQGKRVEAWMKAIEKVKRMLQTWRVIVDVAVTYAESCDSCKNDRFSMLEMMMKVLVVIPEPPIIELPKWPDIVVDVSQIQAGVKVVLPDFVFVPEPLILPPLPKFDIPDVLLPNVKVTLPSVPALPVIPDINLFLPDLPNLPPLPLPTLPDLPPPPEIPELPKPVFELTKSLNVIFKILCLIKQGLLPVSEPEVATEIETLTQRGLNPLLSLDTALGFELPPISYTYVDQIEILGKLNFQLDIDYIYNIVNDSAELINSFSSYGVNYVNQKAQEGADYADQYIPDQSDIKFPDLDVEVDIPGDESAPSLEEQVFNENTGTLQANMLSYAKQVKAINEYSKSVPDKIYLTATNQMIDTSHPLFDHNVEDVKKRIARLNGKENAPKYLVSMRDRLIARYDLLDKGSAHLQKINNNYDLMRFIAEENKNRSLLADSSFDLSGERESTFDFKPSSENLFAGLDGPVREARNMQDRLIALTDETTNNSSLEQGGSPKGMFIYDEEKHINHALISYTQDIGSPASLAYFDADRDGDEDILYSFGGDIYLKRNYKTHTLKNFVKSKPETANLSEFSPPAEAINNLNSTFTANEEVGIAFDPTYNKDLQAYELMIKYNFESFDNPLNTAGSMVHLIPEEEKTLKRAIPTKYVYKLVNGELNINGEEAGKEGELNAGDFVYTSDDLNTEIHIDAYTRRNEYAGSIKLGPSSNWLVQDILDENNVFAFNRGEIIFALKDASTPFLMPGDRIETGDAKVLIEYSDGREFLINQDQNFVLSPAQKTAMYVADIDFFTDAKISSKKRFITSLTAGVLEEGTIVHFLEDGTVSARNGGEVLQSITQKAHGFYRVPAGLPQNTVFEVDSGKIEIIFPNSTVDTFEAKEGMAIMTGDFVEVASGAVTLSYSDSDAKADVKASQTFGLFTYDDPGKPEAKIELLNGSYYGQIRSVLKDNSRGTSSKPVILAPQSCGDKSSPYINVGETEKELAIFQSTSIDASSSFDASGQIVAYYADLNLKEDDNGDGDPTNDINRFSDLPTIDKDLTCYPEVEMDNPVFTFGKYDRPGQHRVKIFAVDQSCNISGQEVVINVFVPQIFLDESSARSGILSGHIEPPIDDMPISFIRDRHPPVEFFSTDSADENGKYYTNAYGEFEVSDLSGSRLTTVDDAKGNSIAEIDPTSGNIKLKDNNYRVEILPARPPDTPTRAAILNRDNEIMSSFFIVPDLNSDSKLVEDFDSSDKSVQIKVLAGGDFKFNVLPANDTENPGATEIRYVPQDSLIALINASGNIFSFDEKVQLILDNHKDGLYQINVISIYFDGKKIAEVFIPGQNFDGQLKQIHERDLSKFNAVGTRPKVAVANKKAVSPFEDVQAGDSYANSIINLAQKGILDGYNENGKLLYKPEQLITRAEYTKILLKTLCIEPSKEAYRGPSPFSDIQFNENNIPWFYPFVKESFLQDFIQGYTGEKDPQTGKSPFKAANSISQAEAATIVLSALNKLGIMDLSGIEPGDPWYAPYIEVSQNLTPYLKELKENTQVFLLTKEESADPNKKISRAEFAVMAERVFNAYNCYELDEDKDGMPTEWEKANNLNPYDPADAAQDPDNDQLSNLDEYRNSTDPFNPDTDSGCMQDGPEVKAGFNAAGNPDDDDPDFDGLSCNAEINIYKTDPRKADTDSGGVNDGTEVLKNKTDPLFAGDDKVSSGDFGQFEDLKTDLDQGVYAIEESCRVCPCPSSLNKKADIMEGDDFWAVISNPGDAYEIFRKSNSVKITNIP